MHPLKFLEVSDLSWSEFEPAGITSPACLAAAQAFRVNLNRVFGLVSLSPYTVWVTTEWAAASAHASTLLLGPDAQLSGPDDPRGPEVARRAMILMRDSINSKMETRSLMMTHMTKVFETYVAHSRPDIHEATESLLKSIIIQTWTAIETLAQDLWERALNEHPRGLSQVGFPEQEKKGISVEILQELGFDLSSRMGTLLKPKFKFQTLGGIRFAYEQAFKNGSSAVMVPLKDKNIDAINLLRNVLVHSGGVIDQNFLDQSKHVAILATIRAHGKDKTIPFDGEMVGGYVKPAIKCCADLLVAVDAWLHKY